MTEYRTNRRTLLGAVTAALASLKASQATAQSPDSALAPPTLAPDQPGKGVAPGLGEQLTRRMGQLAARVREGGISLSEFGFSGDGVTDDTAAWKQAIAFAGTHRIRTIIVPAGVSLVKTSIADAASPLPPGLTFIGEGAAADSPYATQSRLKYIGSGVCWDVAYPVGGPAVVGRWAWVSMTFQCSDPAGTMFSFGDPLNHVPRDAPTVDPHMFIQGIELRGTMAFGGGGTGDFFRACKAFEINVDAASSVYGFRRAFWLRGCDNSEIACRMVGNNRGVMIERHGDFGNNNRVNIHYTGGTQTRFGGEKSYSIYDTGLKTTIEKGTLLEGSAMTAHLYLGGVGTDIYSPVLGEKAPFFELAPTAREVVMYSPRCTVIDQANAPIIAPAADPNFGNTQTDFRMRIFDAPQSIQAIIPDHPRIVMLGRLRNPSRNAPDPTKSLLLGDAGFQEASHICTAYDYWGVQGSPGGGGIKEFVRDATIGRWVMRLTKDRPNEQSIVLNFVVGQDIQPGIYRLVNRMRLASGTSSAGWALVALYNGALFSNAFRYATGPTYTTYSDVLDLSAAVRGRTVSINLYNSSAGANGVDLLVEAIGLVPVLDTGWTAGTGRSNKGAFTAYDGQVMSASYSRAEVQAVANAARDATQRTLALEEAMRRQGIIN
jgi:hypothetical protein